MSEAIRFLHALAQALSTAALYAPGHPATAKAIEVLWRTLEALMATAESPTFLFLGGAPVYDGRALHELAAWPWGPRLAEAGVQRLEFDERVTAAGLASLLNRIELRLEAGAHDTEDASTPIDGIRFGMVDVIEGGEETEGDDANTSEDETPVEEQLDLTDELAAMAYIMDEARAGRLARSEADVVVRILAGQLDRIVVPELSSPSDPGAYPPYLALHTALLAMATAAQAGIDRRGRHTLGVAALLADIGMMRLGEPFEHRDNLDGPARPLMEEHTTRGAAFLLSSAGKGSELAATVALEHHLRPDGNGYPARRFTPVAHWASRLVAVCSAYGSLRAARPFRPAWARSRAVTYLEESAGTVYDAEAARAVASLLRSARAD
ncbi:MAG: HD domain-containing phosphohydrolase [Gemmatimonadota bacterium]